MCFLILVRSDPAVFGLLVDQIFGVTIIHCHSNYGFQDEIGSVSLFANQTGSHKPGIATWQIFEKTSKKWAEFADDMVYKKQFRDLMLPSVDSILTRKLTFSCPSWRRIGRKRR